jgi:hypothetical protein
MMKTKWEELSRTRRATILTLASIEVALTATALVDLAVRPDGLVRGRRKWWALGCLVQPIGPVAYLAWGRRTPVS